MSGGVIARMGYLAPRLSTLEAFHREADRPNLAPERIPRAKLILWPFTKSASIVMERREAGRRVRHCRSTAKPISSLLKVLAKARLGFQISLDTRRHVRCTAR